MLVKTLRADLVKYLTKHNIAKQFKKQVELFEANPRHPFLSIEVPELKKLKIYSFRITRKYRAIFIVAEDNEVEVIDINLHYQ